MSRAFKSSLKKDGKTVDYPSFNDDAHLSTPIDAVPNGGEHTQQNGPIATPSICNGTLPASNDMPDYDDWWKRAPDVPPWVLEARERHAVLRALCRENGLPIDPPAYVTMYESEMTVSKRFDLTRDEATGAYGLTSPKTKAS